MSTYTNQTKSQSAGGGFRLKIDATHFLKTDDTYELLIDDGVAPVTWTNQNKS